MKKHISLILTILFIISIIIISGCSSGKGDKLQNLPRDRQFQPDRAMNLTEEERQQMMEERAGGRGFGEDISEEDRQQIAIEACEGKNEGDPCQFETPRGSMDGTCQIREDNLVCMGDMSIGEGSIGDRSMRQR